MEGHHLAILEAFPSVQHAFAYGSGVFKQPGLYSESVQLNDGPMVDLIFAVEDPVAWHRENIARHRAHYSLMKWFGPGAVDWVAERVGAGVYFNTLVPWNRGMIKYGVVSTATLQRDLLAWDSLYLAGRLHKAVAPLATAQAVAQAQALNLESALRAALLLVGDEPFSLRQLLRVLCGLSYGGDVRMGVAEDSRKVERIVEGSFDRLSQLYAPALEKAEAEWGVLGRRGSGFYDVDCSAAGRAPLVAALPSALLARMATGVGRPSLPPGLLREPAARAALAADLAGFSGCEALLRRCLAATVRASSVSQAAAGVLAAGAVRSVRYAWRKLKKAGSEDATARFLAKAGFWPL